MDQAVMAPPRPFSRRPVEDDHAALLDHHRKWMRHCGYTLLDDNAAQLLVDGPSTYDAMFAAVRRARCSIDVESYIFENKGPGEKLGTLLVERARAGVTVRVLYDSVGSFEVDDAFFESLEAEGISVCEFNPIRPWRRLTGLLDINHRDHRKVMIIDDTVAFVGGVNISHVYSSSSMKLKRAKKVRGRGGWRDTHMRLRGPAVTELARAFDANWDAQGCSNTRERPACDPATDCSADECAAAVGIVPSNADEGDSPIRALLRDALNNARHSARLTMAYFVPDDAMLDALIRAARRGVEVEIMLPGNSDSAVMACAGQFHYAKLLDAGARIYEHQGKMLHAKTVVIDGVWSTIGSCNFDWRSFCHNDEINAVAISRELGTAMEALFGEDRENARQIHATTWKQRGLWQRCCERFVMLGAYFL